MLLRIMWRRTVRSRGVKHLYVGFSTAARTRSCCGTSGKTWVTPSGFDTGVKTYNSLTKQKEPLILAREGVATWYGELHEGGVESDGCGITCPCVSGTAVDPPCTTTPTWVTHGNDVNTATTNQSVCVRERELMTSLKIL